MLRAKFSSGKIKTFTTDVAMYHYARRNKVRIIGSVWDMIPIDCYGDMICILTK